MFCIALVSEKHIPKLVFVFICRTSIGSINNSKAFASSMAVYFKGNQEERNISSNAFWEANFPQIRTRTSHCCCQLVKKRILNFIIKKIFIKRSRHGWTCFNSGEKNSSLNMVFSFGSNSILPHLILCSPLQREYINNFAFSE